MTARGANKFLHIVPVCRLPGIGPYAEIHRSYVKRQITVAHAQDGGNRFQLPPPVEERVYLVSGDDQRLSFRSVRHSLRVRPDKDIFPPSLEALTARTVDQFIIPPLIADPHARTLPI